MWDNAIRFMRSNTFERCSCRERQVLCEQSMMINHGLKGVTQGDVILRTNHSSSYANRYFEPRSPVQGSLQWIWKGWQNEKGRTGEEQNHFAAKLPERCSFKLPLSMFSNTRNLKRYEVMLKDSKISFRSAISYIGLHNLELIPSIHIQPKTKIKSLNTDIHTFFHTKTQKFI